VTWLGVYVLHIIKSHSTQREKVPHLAHLGHRWPSARGSWGNLSVELSFSRAYRLCEHKVEPEDLLLILRRDAHSSVGD
jgi:hypothetical protein